jgi:hypothetical protein
MIPLMISSLSLPAFSSTPSIRDVRANERLTAPPATNRTGVNATPAISTAPNPNAPRGSILNLSV